MRNTRYEMNKAFTLVEILIVVAILGILAALALPTLQGHMTEAKESAAKDNLRILRQQIEIYAAQHNGVPPGYWGPGLINARVFEREMIDGGYIPKIPENPFNEMHSMQMIADGDDFPATATGAYGWIYKPQTKQIRLDLPGTDSQGTLYFDY